ncbi:MAG: hypothetical protein GWP08_18500, partial [Nitrospiraceae bacterium]|nr:hypothetical protein [Nitrospiraceae bacterium]
PSLIVPDNLRSGVSYSCRYDPDANPTYRDYVLFAVMLCSRFALPMNQGLRFRGQHIILGFREFTSSSER